MLDKKLYIKTLFILLLVPVTLFTLAFFVSEETFGLIYVYSVVGPVYMAQYIGLPAIEYFDLTSRMLPLGYITVVVFYLMLAYILALIWSKFFKKAKRLQGL